MNNKTVFAFTVVGGIVAFIFGCLFGSAPDKTSHDKTGHDCAAYITQYLEKGIYVFKVEKSENNSYGYDSGLRAILPCRDWSTLKMIIVKVEGEENHEPNKPQKRSQLRKRYGD